MACIGNYFISPVIVKRNYLFRERGQQISAEGWSGGGLDNAWSGKVMKISKMACVENFLPSPVIIKRTCLFRSSHLGGVRVLWIGGAFFMFHEHAL